MAAMRLGPVPGPITLDSYDSQFHAYFSGLGSYGNVTSGLTVIEPGGFALKRRLDNFRRAIGGRIAQNLDQPAEGIARALIIGDQSGISDEVRERMATAGLAHVLAISGLHLTMVAGGLFAAVRMLLALSTRLAGRVPVKAVAAGAGILTAVAYMLVSGMSIPSIRATIMLGLVFGAVLAGRQALTMRNVAIAALVILITDPSSLFAAGFQLSFAAVAGLIGVYELTRAKSAERPTILRRAFGFFGAIAMTSFIAGGATLLFAAYHFQQTAPFGVIGNVLALPLVGFVIMPAGFVGTLLMPLGFEYPFFAAMGWGIERMLEIATIVSAMSTRFETHPLLDSLALIVGMGAIAWFVFLRDVWRFAGPVVAVPVILIFAVADRPNILAADTTQAVAVRHDAGLVLMLGRVGTFAVDAWSDTYGEPIMPDGGISRCDPFGCFADLPGRYAISIVTNPRAFIEDCPLADLVITKLDAPPDCARHAQIIDATDFRLGGVHSARWDPSARHFTIRAAIPDPHRPWRPYRTR